MQSIQWTNVKTLTGFKLQTAIVNGTKLYKPLSGMLAGKTFIKRKGIMIEVNLKG